MRSGGEAPVWTGYAACKKVFEKVLESA